MDELGYLLHAIAAARYFPGDPPLFELFVLMSFLGLLVTSALILLSHGMGKIRWLQRVGAIFEMLLVLPMALLTLIFVGAWIGIASRHFGEWAELKRLLQENSARIERHVKDPKIPLTGGEMAQMEMKFLTPAPTFRFRAWKEPVRLRIMMAVPPYVGLDFGNGANAVLDPETMICTYAD